MSYLPTAKLRNCERLVTYREPSQLPAINFYFRAFKSGGYGPPYSLGVHASTASAVRHDAPGL